MIVAEKIKDFFAQDTFVLMTKKGDFVFKSHWWVIGRVVRWIHSSQYFDLSTVWKAHQAVTSLVTSSQSSPQIQEKLRSLQTAVTSLGKSRKLDLLVPRINAAIASLNPQQEEAPFSAAGIANKFVTSLGDAKELIRKLSPEQKKEVECLVCEYFFEPVLVEATSCMKEPGLSSAEYHQALQKVRKAYIQIFEVFGRDELLKYLDQYHFLEYVRDNFLLPLSNNWLTAFQGKKKDIADTLSQLNSFVNEVDTLHLEWLEKDAAWIALQEKFQQILPPFFSRKVSLSLNKTFCPLDRPKHLSPAYTEDKKEVVERWLSPIQDADCLLSELPRQLNKGVYVGDTLVTADSLNIPQEVVGQDREILLCWGLFQRISAYFRENSIRNPEKAATSLMTYSTLQYVSVDFFSVLGKFANRHINGFILTPEQVEPGQKIGVSFSCQGKHPVAYWEGVFFHPELPEEPGFFVRASIKQSGDRGFTEKMETTPCVFTGNKFHIKESTQGTFGAYQDTVWSKLCSVFGSKKVFPFSQEGILQFGKRVDKILEQPNQATVLSLCHLERTIRRLSLMKNIPFAKDSPVGKVLEKVDSLKTSVFANYDVAFGMSLGNELLEKVKGTDISYPDFLSLLDREINEIRKRNEFPARIIEGVFKVVETFNPEFKTEFEAQEKHIQFSVLQECIERRIKSSDNQRSAYDSCIKFLKSYGPYYKSRFPDLLEQIYVEKVALLLATSMTQEMEVQGFEEFKHSEQDLNSIKELFPEPQTPILDAVFHPLHEVALSRGVNILFWLGFEVGTWKKGDVLKTFQAWDSWFSRAFSSQGGREVAEGLRRSSGYHYGESLFAQITEFKNSDVFEAVSKERTRAPRWYSEEVRGMLSQLVRVLDEKELGAFCQEYAEKEVLSRFEDNPLDRFFKYFKPFLCGPSSKCSVRILSTFLKKICEKPKIQISPFFTNLYGQVEQEVKLMFDEEKWKEESREYLNQLLDLEFPEEYKKIIRDSVQG